MNDLFICINGRQVIPTLKQRDEILDMLTPDMGFSDSVKEHLDLPIRKIEISRRLERALNYLDVDTVRDMMQISKQEFMVTPNVGIKTLYELRNVIANISDHYKIPLIWE